MDFSFSEEQQMLRDTTERFIATRYGFEARQAIRDSEEGWSPAIWKELAELGLLALLVPEADGGIGADPVAAMLVMRAMGAGLLLEPYLSSAVVATAAVVAAPPSARRSELLAALGEGRCIAALATERMPEDADDDLPRADRDDAGWRLSGRCSSIYHAPLADRLLVPARHRTGLVLLDVPSDAQGLSISAGRSLDDQPLGDLLFDALRLDAEACLDPQAETGVQRALDLGTAALCADALGSLERALQASVDYCKQRTQFGSPIGRFQALQHRLADMLIEREQALSLCYLAATSVDLPQQAARHTALSAAKFGIGRAARFVSQQAVQVHGGMGMTDELDVSHHFRRLTAFALRFGDQDAHLQRHAMLSAGHPELAA